MAVPAGAAAADAAGEEHAAGGDLDLTALALGAGGETGALISYLESMAANLEAESGEPETEIRGKIALLQRGIEAQPGALAEQRARMASAVRAAEQQQQADDGPGGEDAESALHAVVMENVARAEEGVERVEALVREDPQARELLAATSGMWMRAPQDREG